MAIRFTPDGFITDMVIDFSEWFFLPPHQKTFRAIKCSGVAVLTAFRPANHR
jgi:hypothetical protein